VRATLRNLRTPIAPARLNLRANISCARESRPMGTTAKRLRMRMCCSVALADGATGTHRQLKFSCWQSKTGALGCS